MDHRSSSLHDITAKEVTLSCAPYVYLRMNRHLTCGNGRTATASTATCAAGRTATATCAALRAATALCATPFVA